MFTIKHVAASGREFAMEAMSYEVTREQDNFIRVRTYDTPYSTDDYTGLWVGASVHHSGPDVDTIFVMNGQGSTVARINFMPQVGRVLGSASDAQSIMD